jgi:diguanylate cyclase (GGDEF)-like protein
VLKSLAQLLVRRLRQADIVGRYGGEEFVILLPGATEIMAKKIIDELRQNFHQVRHVARDQEFSLSFSGGIASYPRFDSPALLFEMADRALYQAKQQGRNRILIAD